MEQTISLVYEQTIEQLECLGHHTCFEYMGASVGLYSDEPEIACALSEHFAGYFITTNNKLANVTVYSSQDVTLFNHLYERVTDTSVSGKDYSEEPLDATRSLIFDRQIYREQHTESICYVLDRARRTILISYIGAPQNRSDLVMRIVRNLTRLQLLEKGWIPLNAATFEKDGVGICVIGDKAAGKTSTLMNLLASPNTRLVTPTKVFICDSGHSIEVCGFPREIGVRIGTLLTLPLLHRWLDRAPEYIYQQISIEELHEIAATTPVEELKNKTRKIFLKAQDLVELFGVSIAPATTLQAFLSVKFDMDREEACMQQIEGDEALLTVARYFHPLFHERQKFLQSFFSLTEELLFDRLAALLMKYSSAITVQELSQNAHTNAQSELLVCELAKSIKDRCGAA